VTVDRLWHPEKQHFEMTSTDDGIQIDSSDEQPRNAFAPRIEIRQPTSNPTLNRFLHNEKQFAETVSTNAGIEIDVSNEQ
jgi:hypothetical protein